MSRIRIIFAVLAMLLFSPVNNSLYAQNNILVYSTIDYSYTYDVSGFDDDLPEILENHGYFVTVTDRIITPEITNGLLANYNQLWVLSTNPQAGGNFSSDELIAINSFRNSGKGMLLIADHTAYADDVNQISTSLGVTFYGTVNHGYQVLIYPNFEEHPLFNGVQSILGHQSSAAMSISGSVEAVASHLGYDIIAVLEDGFGRVVFDISFVKLLDDGTASYPILINAGDNPQYVRNIADWLSIGCSFYLPGDVNMYAGAWPPAATGPDVTYLVNFFRGALTSQACPLGGFWCSADANGDCNIIGSDVTKLVNVFRGIGSIDYCPDYPPAWPPIPAEAPSGWPNCE